MAYVAPTAADLKARFPAFAAVADTAVNGALGEAARRVDISWPEEDFALAQMLYAAHVLTMDKLGTATETLLAGFKSVTVGPIRLDVASSATAAGGLTSTSFGTRFLELQALNFAGPLTT